VALWGTGGHCEAQELQPLMQSGHNVKERERISTESKSELYVYLIFQTKWPWVSADL
jgi:hypothetical protein